MNLTKTTQVPNAVFDHLLPILSSSALKILLVIIRQTIGWKDNRSATGRKDRDWISASQLHKKSGCSKRSISMAVSELVTLNAIQVFDIDGMPLANSLDRRGKPKLFYRMNSRLYVDGDNLFNSMNNPVQNNQASANNAEDMRKKITELAHNLRITKETIQN